MRRWQVDVPVTFDVNQWQAHPAGQHSEDLAPADDLKPLEREVGVVAEADLVRGRPPSAMTHSQPAARGDD